MARPGRSRVYTGFLPRLVCLAGADRAGLAAAQHLHRMVWAAAHTLLDAVQELRPVGPGTPFIVSGSTDLLVFQRLLIRLTRI